MGDLGCAVESQGIVVMRETKIKDAQWKVCDWTISICLAQRDKALQTISHKAFITYDTRKYDLCVSPCCLSSHANIRSTCRLEYRKILVRAFPFKTCRNTSSFQQ